MRKRYYWWGLIGVLHWTEQLPKRRASPISLRPRESAATPGGASEKNQPLNQKIGEQNQKAGGPERVLQP